MESLLIQSLSHSYHVRVKSGIRHNILEYLEKTYQSYYVITDQHVQGLYWEDLANGLPENSTYLFTVEPGEQSKSFSVYQAILTDMLSKQLDRSCCVIALGGGVIGDLAGFVASTFLRGVDYVQVPTTLLAHDSSVGGKVAINHELGKNLIGAFYPPVAVLYDTECLATLPEREWRSGFAEMIKHALLDSDVFLHDLMTAIPNQDQLTLENVEPFLLRAIQVKEKVVMADEKEKGVRMTLNFGHTLGHSLEKLSGYGTLTHGEGVAIGMLFSMFISCEKGNILPMEVLKEWFSKLGLPVRINSGLSIDQCLGAMFYDKKKDGNKINFILLQQVGKAYPERLSKEELNVFLNAFIGQTH